MKKHDNQFRAIVEFIQKGGKTNSELAKKTFQKARSDAGKIAYRKGREKVIEEIRRPYYDPSHYKTKIVEEALSKIKIKPIERKKDIVGR